MDAASEGFPKVESVEVDTDALAKLTREEPFIELAFNLLRESAAYVCIGANIMGPRPTWHRHQAVVGGNMARLFKLMCGLLDQASQRRLETTSIMGRLVFETCVNIRYLSLNFSPELFDSYIRYSLRHERRLHDRIQSNVAARSGVVLPIEDRMLKSLARAERLAGISLSSVDLKDKAPWGGKNLYDKAEAVGLENLYLAAFGGLSHNIHGNWQDLYQFHLEAEDSENPEFKPNLGWSRLRPQYLFGLATTATETVENAAGFLGGQYAVDDLKPRLDDLMERVNIGNQAHEAYLQKKTWPEI